MHFLPLFPLQIFLFLIFIYSWGVCTTLRKILDILDENQQRNNLSKLGTLKHKFPQLLHSALGGAYNDSYPVGSTVAAAGGVLGVVSLQYFHNTRNSGTKERVFKAEILLCRQKGGSRIARPI